MGTCNRRVKFGLEISSCLGKMSANLRGDVLTHTVARPIRDVGVSLLLFYFFISQLIVTKLRLQMRAAQKLRDSAETIKCN